MFYVIQKGNEKLKFLYAAQVSGQDRQADTDNNDAMLLMMTIGGTMYGGGHSQMEQITDCQLFEKQFR